MALVAPAATEVDLGLVAEQFAFAKGTRLPAKSRISMVMTCAAPPRLTAVQRVLPFVGIEKGGVARVGSARPGSAWPSNTAVAIANANALRGTYAVRAMVPPSQA